MPRKARTDAPGALPHIIIRGIERKAVFKDNAERDNFIERLGGIIKATETFDMALHPWYEPIERLVTFSEQKSVTLITPEIGEIINLRSKPRTDHWWLKYKTNDTIQKIKE